MPPIRQGKVVTPAVPMASAKTTTPSVNVPLGRVVITPGARDVLWRASGTDEPVTHDSLLHRHATGDWGDLDNHDRKENDYALIHDLRILSAYTIDDETVWVITEHDRSVTTLLLPGEY